MAVVKIRIESNGLVSEVDAPIGVDVEIYDYATDGADPNELQKDEEGRPCFFSEYAGSRHD